MKTLGRLVLALIIGLFFWQAMANAHPRVQFGIRLGFPLYPRICGWDRPCHYYRYRTIHTYPVYVDRPVVVRPVPVFVDRPELLHNPAPIREIPKTSQTQQSHQYTSTAPPPLSANVKRDADANQYVQLLRSPDERVRSDAALKLGRMKAERAVYELATALASDASPIVRDAAARALGLIGSPKALATLSHAAKTDRDRDVRRSAQFAMDVIETNQKR